MVTNQIKEQKYSLKEALDKVPSGKLQEVKEDLALIFGLSTSAIWYYTTGKSQPTLARAKMAEEYFELNFGIKEVWKPIED